MTTACTYVLKFHGQDLEPERLQLHHGMLIDKTTRNTPKKFEHVEEMLWGDKGEQLRYLLPNVAKLAKVDHTSHIPHIKENVLECSRDLRSTIGQAQLNHIALLHGGEELARKINLGVIADDFI